MTRQFLSASLVIAFALLLGLMIWHSPQVPHGEVVHAAESARLDDENFEPSSGSRSIFNASVVNNPQQAALLSPNAQNFNKTFYVTEDTWVDEANPTTNYGDQTTIYIGHVTSNARQGLVRFDLSELPSNALVISATLEMYTVMNLKSAARPELAYNIWTDAITANWTEMSVTWNNRPAAANQGDPPTLVSMGCGGCWFTWDVSNIVQGWASGTLENYGILLRGDGSTQENNWFTASPSTYRPRLRVAYITEGSPLMLPVQEDAWVDEAAPSDNYGSDGWLYVGRDASYNAKQILLKFDTSSLPSDIVVTGATLDMYTVMNMKGVTSPTLAYTVSADAIHVPWSESNVTWNNKPSATNQGDPPTIVAMGCGGCWFSWDVTNIAQGWASGALENYGILLRGDYSTQSNNWFVAQPDTNLPRLTITYEPIPCEALTGVSVSGPTSGITDTAYTFTATVSPLSASPPFTYTWQATDQNTQVISTSATSQAAIYTWNTPGTKLVQATVENCGDTIVTTHYITVEVPDPTCEFPLTGLSLSGSSQGVTNTNYSFTATVSPPNATPPLTYTWQASGQNEVEQNGAFTQTSLFFNWNSTGAKHITITAENCGASFVDYHIIDLVEPAQLPDLVVSDAWYEREGESRRIGYLIKNVGGSTTPPIHQTAFYTGAVLVDHYPFTHTLQPGAIRASYIDHEWGCAYSSRVIKLCSDGNDALVEGDEDNNCWHDWWDCDLELPEFTAGPEVVTTTETTATITWQTNEICKYDLEYHYSYYAPYSVSDSSYDSSKQVVLTGLQPGRTYYYQVLVTDYGGNSINSQELFFETQPVGSDPPQLSDLSFKLYTYTLPYEFYLLEASVGNPDGMDRIEFYWDGVLVGSDYAMYESFSPGYQVYFSPHDLGLARDTFFGQSHSLEARGFTIRGVSANLSQNITPVSRPMPYALTIFSPPDDYTVYLGGDTQIDVGVLASVYEWGCSWDPSSTGAPPGVSRVDCQDALQAADQLDLRLDGALKDSITPSGANYVYNVFSTLDFSTESVGAHTLSVMIHTADGNTGSEQHTINVDQGEPGLSLERQTTRIDNYFQVQITLHNDSFATASAEVDKIVDRVTGLQPMDKAGPPYSVTSAYSPYDWENEVTLNLFTANGDTVTLDPGESVTVEYIAVPIMYDISMGAAFGPIDVHYKVAGVEQQYTGWPSGYQVYDAASGTTVSLGTAMADARRQADYLIVTHPTRLFTHNANDDDVNRLLSKMAHLAYLKDGTLGYMMTQVMPYLMLDVWSDPTGDWGSKLHANYAQPGHGYLLIVGESEIVPSWESDEIGVGFSDQPYVKTLDGTPSLVVGRIIGNDAAKLTIPIQTSINVHEGQSGYGFDRSHALIFSGIEWDYFMDNLNEIHSIIAPEFNVSKLHTKQYVIEHSFYRDYEKHDGFAVGDVNGDGTDDIIVADRDDHIYVLNANGSVIGGFSRSFDRGDRMAVGDVNGDGTDEIIIGDRDDAIVTYNQNGTQLASFSQNFEEYDGLAVGDVSGNVTEEIVMADRDDHLYVFDMNGTVLHSSAYAYSAHDGLAVGNVTWDSGDEIIIAEKTAQSPLITGTVRVYSLSSGALVEKYSFERDFEAGDQLAAGDLVDGGWGVDEIIIADFSKDWLYIYKKDGDRASGSLPTHLDAYDGLAVGNVDGAAKMKILLADRDDYVHRFDTHFAGTAYQDLEPMMPNKDLLVYRGHGSPGGIGIVNFYKRPFDFGNSNPLILAPTCLSGNYEFEYDPGHAYNDYGIAEAMLESYAGAYIGATEVSYGGPNNYAGKWFMEHWDSSESVGQAFFDLELEQSNDEYWVWEYNLYGDPKYGIVASTLADAHVEISAVQAPTSPLVVDVPAFEVITTTSDGVRVEIPGGGLLVEPGQYPIPIWTVSLDYPAGYRVQDVLLAERSGLVVTTGLNINATTSSTDSLNIANLITSMAVTDTFVPDPEQIYDWRVQHNPDGSSNLRIRLYPFYYNPSTTDAKFYPHYRFDLQTITTTVEIDYLATNQYVYTQGAKVLLDLGVNNSGAAQDVIVKAFVKGPQGQAVDGFPLRNLHDLVGNASTTLEWNSTGFAPGDYHAVVELHSLDGSLLDETQRGFHVGITSGEVSLSATPENFSIGDTINLTLSFSNTGDVPITGTAVIQIQLDSGKVITNLNHAITNLVPGSTRAIADSWNTIRQTGGEYHVVGFVRYNSTTSAPAKVNIRAAAKGVYLPIVLRNP